jgi:hypothetical protein
MPHLLVLAASYSPAEVADRLFQLALDRPAWPGPRD